MAIYKYRSTFIGISVENKCHRWNETALLNLLTNKVRDALANIKAHVCIGTGGAIVRIIRVLKPK